MIVLDAPAVTDLLLQLGAHEGVEERISRPGETLHAPHLLDVEVLCAIRRLERTGALPADAARLAIGDLELLPVIRYSHTVLVARIWELRQNLTPGDAA